ncbi:hypothetical protein BDR07DRAFT_1377622 [Suillus spraguei]|nr:hypothetical protein BDR07DRAFT_1377622 [Suillus spraguei]
MSQVFGVIQKCQVCRAAVLQVQKKTFHQNEDAFQSLTAHDLAVASVEESNHQSHSNLVVESLKQHVNTVQTKVTSTDESCTKIRALIWGMTMMKNPLSLWITINPSNTHDLITQAFIGEEIDLDALKADIGPDAHYQSINNTSDPYAAAQFFHYVIHAILEDMFGITISGRGKITCQTGIFGVVEGYIGTVEAQGWGTHHLHLIVLLQDAPSSLKMKELLSSSSFRAWGVHYIASNIKGSHADVTEQTLSIIPLQIHKCGPGCLRSWRGRLFCKCRAPFPVAEEAWININGEWGP